MLPMTICDSVPIASNTLFARKTLSSAWSLLRLPRRSGLSMPMEKCSEPLPVTTRTWMSTPPPRWSVMSRRAVRAAELMEQETA